MLTLSINSILSHSLVKTFLRGLFCDVSFPAQQHLHNKAWCYISTQFLNIVHWETEGCWCCLRLFSWEPNGYYLCTKSMTLVSFWFSMTHCWTLLTHVFFSANDILCMHNDTSSLYLIQFTKKYTFIHTLELLSISIILPITFTCS